MNASTVTGLRRLAGTGALLLAVMLVSACSVVPDQRATSEPDMSESLGDPLAARRARLAERADWRLTGRISLATEEDAWHGTLDWRQLRKRYQIGLTGPFGHGAVQVAGNEGGVEMRTAEGGVFQDSNPDALIARELGVALPVRALRYWVRGLPVPDLPVELVFDDATGEISQMTQAGWVIDFRSRVVASGLAMPKKVFAEREGVRLRLSIGRWFI